MPVTPLQLQAIARPGSIDNDARDFNAICNDIDSKLKQVATNFAMHTNFDFAAISGVEITSELEALIRQSYVDAGWRDLKVISTGRSANFYVTVWNISAHTNGAAS